MASGRAVRASAVLIAIGATLILLAIPLWNVTRSDSFGCVAQQTHPCDLKTYTPFAPLAVVLALVGVAAFMAVLVVLLAVGFRRVRALDAQERAARRASVDADA
jgi:hypothetical protein